MKKRYYLLLLLVISVVNFSCSHSTAYIPEPVPESFDDDGIAMEPTTSAVLRVIPTEVYQEIDGFGCAFAEWSHRIYTNTKRLEVVEALFSENGLGLNIFRGEAFPHYGKDDGTYDFGLNAHFNRSATDPYLINGFWGDTALRVRLGQMWLVNEITSNPDKYKVDKFLFSTWSPPGYMKTSGKPDGGSILPEKKKEFANYLAEFVKGYEEKFNFEVYAISPTNEPNTGFGSWSVCSWTPESLANFIVDDLRPALTAQGLKTNIVLGEHSWWAAGNKYVDNAIAANPEVAKVSQIAAGHGYFTSDAAIVPYQGAVDAGLKVWNTEFSNTSTKDVGWVKDALTWATTFERYLEAGNVNGLVWWAGARPALNNEPLIYLEEAIPSTDFELTPRYHALGHFSKFIKAGSHRVGIEASQLSTKSEEGEEEVEIFPSELSYTAYVNNENNTFTIVAINRLNGPIETLVEIEGEEIENMRIYSSTVGTRWMHKKVNPSLTGARSLMIPAEGIVTITGKIR